MCKRSIQTVISRRQNETTETQQDSGEKANHACFKFSSKKINYRTDEELVSSPGSAFITINFLNFRRSFLIGM